MKEWKRNRWGEIGEECSSFAEICMESTSILKLKRFEFFHASNHAEQSDKQSESENLHGICCNVKRKKTNKFSNSYEYNNSNEK